MGKEILLPSKYLGDTDKRTWLYDDPYKVLRFPKDAPEKYRGYCIYIYANRIDDKNKYTFKLWMDDKGYIAEREIKVQGHRYPRYKLYADDLEVIFAPEVQAVKQRLDKQQAALFAGLGKFVFARYSIYSNGIYYNEYAWGVIVPDNSYMYALDYDIAANKGKHRLSGRAFKIMASYDIDLQVYKMHRADIQEALKRIAIADDNKQYLDAILDALEKRWKDDFQNTSRLSFLPQSLRQKAIDNLTRDIAPIREAGYKDISRDKEEAIAIIRNYIPDFVYVYPPKK